MAPGRGSTASVRPTRWNDGGDPRDVCPGMEIAVTEQKAIGGTNGGRFDVPRLEIGADVSPSTLLVMLAG